MFLGFPALSAWRSRSSRYPCRLCLPTWTQITSTSPPSHSNIRNCSKSCEISRKNMISRSKSSYCSSCCSNMMLLVVRQLLLSSTTLPLTNHRLRPLPLPLPLLLHQHHLPLPLSLPRLRRRRCRRWCFCSRAISPAHPCLPLAPQRRNRRHSTHPRTPGRTYSAVIGILCAAVRTTQRTSRKHPHCRSSTTSTA